MTTRLDRIAAKAQSDPKLRFTALAHLLTPEFLLETWGQMNRRGASGVDGEMAEEFAVHLEERIGALYRKLRSGAYRPPPVRRVDIPKSGGGSRPLGIPTVEDRLLQRAVARILGAIYEADFLDCSYGFRPGRKQHQALKALRSQFIAGKVMHVHEADIRGYFNRINHQWLRRMLGLRIGDPVILRLITRWLRAGVMDGGLLKRTLVGSPQGGPISPVLANAYLHYALDLWFDRVFKRGCEGEAYLTRWADDFVGCFQHASDARAFGKALERRLAKFELELAPEKTRTLVFGRFARERLAKTGQTPETFEFLGFRHVCGVDRKGRFAVIRLPSQRSCRSFLNRTKYWLKKHMHASVWEQQRGLSQKLRGFYQYFALPHCRKKLSWILREVRRQWRRTLRRRGQRRNRMHWSYLATRAWFQLPWPRSLHPQV